MKICYYNGEDETNVPGNHFKAFLSEHTHEVELTIGEVDYDESEGNFEIYTDLEGSNNDPASPAFYVILSDEEIRQIMAGFDNKV